MLGSQPDKAYLDDPEDKDRAQSTERRQRIVKQSQDIFGAITRHQSHNVYW